MNTYVKILLKGALILLLMIIYWVIIGLLPNIFPEIISRNYSTVFFLQIIFSFFLFIFFVYYYSKKSELKMQWTIALLAGPFLTFLLLMQFAQLNIPRLLDVVLLIIGCLVIYLIVEIKRSNFFKNITLIFFCVFIGLLYPLAYNNIWYYIQKNELNINRNLNEFDFKITNTKGGDFYISDLKGKTICIDMWSSSCGNCISSMPDFEKLNLHFKKDNDYKIVSLYCPLNKEQTFEWFKEYIDRKFDYDIDYYYVDYESFKKLNIREFPEFLIISKSSNLVYRGQISYLPYVSDNLYNKLKSINENY